MNATMRWFRDEADYNVVLELIKRNITGPEDTTQNVELHGAVQVLVDLARRNGHLRSDR